MLPRHGSMWPLVALCCSRTSRTSEKEADSLQAQLSFRVAGHRLPKLRAFMEAGYRSPKLSCKSLASTYSCRATSVADESNHRTLL